jgi:predicted MFS family arabinose efflux permease
MYWVAQGWLIYDITGEPLALGYVGIASSAPSILLSLVGGVLADKLDQKRLIVSAELAASVFLALLATLVVLDRVEVWHILAIAFANGAIRAFNQPARQSLFPYLIDRKDMMNAVAVNNLAWEGTRPIAPALGGVVIALAGAGTAIYFAAAGGVIFALATMSLKVPPIPRAAGHNMWQDMGEGLRFVRENGMFAFLIGMSFFNSFFGMAYVQLVPIFAEDILDVGAAGLGLLISASGAGSLIGTLTAASLSKFRHRGWLLIGGPVFFGGFLTLFAVSNFFPLSLIAIAGAGLSNQLFMITTQTTLQMLVPDVLRGRVMGLYGLTWTIQPMGSMQAGAIATVLGAPAAVAIGGLAVAAYALAIASPNRRIRRLGDATQEPAASGVG